jgi:hypothetical protein
MIVDLEYRGQKVYRDGVLFGLNECAACRRLVEEEPCLGIDGVARFWRAGKKTHDLEMRIGPGARHVVSETGNGPRFTKYNAEALDRLRQKKSNQRILDECWVQETLTDFESGRWSDEALTDLETENPK